MIQYKQQVEMNRKPEDFRSQAELKLNFFQH